MTHRNYLENIIIPFNGQNIAIKNEGSKKKKILIFIRHYGGMIFSIMKTKIH